MCAWGLNLYCWGDDEFYQLGVDSDGTAPQSCASLQQCATYPMPVLNIGTAKTTSVALGTEHSCVLLTDFTVECWGVNPLGQLGLDISIQNENTPTPVPGPLGEVLAIAAGDQHTCVAFNTGVEECWGSNTSGQLGTAQSGTSACFGSSCATSPSGVVSSVGSPQPTLVGVASMSGGQGNSCLIVGGTVLCMGANSVGQLGNGTLSTASTVPVTVQ
jgi:alpha-tubulin suppressor-like RCC1 family protein